MFIYILINTNCVNSIRQISTKPISGYPETEHLPDFGILLNYNNLSTYVLKLSFSSDTRSIIHTKILVSNNQVSPHTVNYFYTHKDQAIQLCESQYLGYHSPTCSYCRRGDQTSCINKLKQNLEKRNYYFNDKYDSASFDITNIYPLEYVCQDKETKPVYIQYWDVKNDWTEDKLAFQISKLPRMFITDLENENTIDDFDFTKRSKHNRKCVKYQAEISTKKLYIFHIEETCEDNYDYPCRERIEIYENKDKLITNAQKICEYIPNISSQEIKDTKEKIKQNLDSNYHIQYKEHGFWFKFRVYEMKID